MAFVLKDPAANVDYVVDWRADYLDQADSLASSNWSVEPVEAGGLAIASDSFADGEARVSAAGGIAGRLYRLTNQVTTASGLSDRRSLTIRVEAR